MDFRRAMRNALREDRAWQDATSKAFVPARARGAARIVSREPGVVAGAWAAAGAFRLLDRRCSARVLVPDGRSVRKNEAVLEVRGPLRALLSAERTALNTLTHLSGIATLTREFVLRAGRGGPRILDTRKTLPGLRDLQKWAVRCGGGQNHRRDLADAVLIKENHLASVKDEKGLARLFAQVRSLRRRGLPVEMECRDRKEILWGLLAGADILLLDNFKPGVLPGAVRWIKTVCSRKKIRRPLLEVSGGVDLSSIGRISRAGVDRVSIGRLTHSAPALDMGMDVKVLP